MRQFQNATKKLGEKNYDKYNEDRKFCKLFCGFAICIPFRVSSSTLSHFMPSNPGLGTARQDNIKTITYSAVAKCNSQQTLQ